METDKPAKGDGAESSKKTVVDVEKVRADVEAAKAVASQVR